MGNPSFLKKIKINYIYISALNLWNVFYSQQRIPTFPLREGNTSKKFWILAIKFQRYKPRLVIFGIIYTRTHTHHTIKAYSFIKNNL